jgi:hypothetical protein
VVGASVVVGRDGVLSVVELGSMHEVSKFRHI